MASLDLGTLKASVVVEGSEKAKSDLRSVNETINSTEKSFENTAQSTLMSNKEMQSSIMKLAHQYKASGMTMSEAMTKANAEIRVSQQKAINENNNSVSSFSRLASAFKDGMSNASVFGMKLGDLGGALSGGAGMSSFMQGAVAGLSMALVNLAVQAVQQAISALWDFSKQAVQTASDLEESANVVEVVFGKENNVSKWAKENASSFNLSRLEAEKFAGTLGAVLTPSGLGIDVIEDMSINLTKLSGDLGSLWNKSSEEAFNALRSAITGETEPMKNFGVVMTQVNLEAYMLTQGINKQWKELTQAEQALVRYNYILENTKTAQGDAIRTADGYANASKQLELAIENAGNAFGQGFLPGLTSFKQHIAEFINDNEELIRLIGNLLGNLVQSFAEAIKIITLPFKGVLTVINWIAGGINSILESVRGKSNEVLDSISSIGKKTSGTVTYEMQDMASATKDAMGDAATSVEDTFNGMEESAKDSLNGISEAYKSFFQKQMSEYEKQLREQYNGGTLREEKKIQEKLALHEKMLNKQLEKDEEYEKRRAEIEKKYRMQSSTENGRTVISYVPRNANGTSYFSGGLTRMNEVGPELMFVERGAKIVNNHETREMFNNIADNSGVENRLDTLISAIQKVERVIKMLPSEQQMLARGGLV
ncbi:MAG: hypothetical protein ACLTBU_02040 [Zhenhengia sp.]|uniref:hypothetical protein n=1 Tax=Zhenhengia sp. TaxID=2944208 RepID=UPI00399532FC